MKKFIGIYDYTVVLTYTGLICALLGIIFAIKGDFTAALLFLGGALLCDTMDGRVARAKKDRTETEKQFGIQIDSLCDVISFGVFPAVICISMGLDSLADYCLLAIYCLCCVIRLGYFNVLAQNEEPETPKGYHGLPVVGMAMFLPAAFLLGMWIPPVAFRVLLRCMLILFGCLYILDFRVKKPKMWLLSLLAAVYLIPMTLILLRK